MHLRGRPAKSNLPAQQAGTDGETGTDAGNKHEIPFVHAILFARGAHGEGNRAGCGVAIAIDVNNDAFERHAHSFSTG